MLRTQRKQREVENYYRLYNQDTEPFLMNVTAPLPNNYYPHESRLRHFLRGFGDFIAAIIRKINQLLGLAFIVLFLLLITRLTLIGFELKTSLFSQWVLQLSDPLVMPFNNLLPAFSYEGFLIDASTLIAIAAYFVGVTIVRWFLKVLSKPV